MKTVPLKELSIELSKEEGILIGEEKGMEKGMEKGKFEVARKMLADGLPAETIRKYTGLDESSMLSLR